MLSPEPFDPHASAQERILNCAHQLFYQNGIRATGVDKIIAGAGVTKVTFYRHFPAKNALVLAFLRRRHQRWMQGFSQTLADALRQETLADALPHALESWFSQPDFRGCAFINAATELADTQPEALSLVVEHKCAMRDEIARHLPPHAGNRADVIAMLVDGAIVQVQMGKSVEQTVRQLRDGLAALLAPETNRAT
ncbi:TetR family transcriptional regulator [Paramixta manurensis]|uniref:TetR family transcriptional regulator n=1 Tax=Paramixta manurensis TaxID=2740817 RepID=A0A6M8US34_9GAMM|nr:TetR family transcriptional regulator [Erwiniaceae bacterium PD-1]